MPHDANNEELKVGDIVSLDCRVTAVQPGEEYCNVTAEAVNPPHPSECGSITVTGNSRQFIKARTPAETVRLAMPQQQPPEVAPQVQQTEAAPAPAAEQAKPEGWVSFADWQKRGLDTLDYPRHWRFDQQGHWNAPRN